ncbi:MAG: oligosaccharide flippase family protein [Melioribacteraceae bacterium]|nr:oligosaccharide flippase family protein [Melioribacteraceae bacterium]MDD3557054.1 oligosaccharide flippase family protein [Melioribacteraceae bacterium]
MKAARNIFSITVSQFLSVVLLIVVFGIVARNISVEEFGLFNYWLAIVGILSKIIDFGFNPIILRECSKDNECRESISSIFIFRLAVFIILILLTNLFLYFLNFEFITILLVNLLFINLIVSSKETNFRDLLQVFFKKDLRMHLPSLFTIIDAVLMLLLMIGLLFVENKFYFFIIVYVAASLPGFLGILVYVIKDYNFTFYFDFTKIKWYLKESLPLYGFVVVSFLFLQLDILFVDYFYGKEAVGFYSIAVRLTRPFLIVPSAIVMTVVPIFVKKIKKNISIQSELATILKSLIIISFSASVLFTFKSTFFITLIFGDGYSTASLATSILFFSLVFNFINFFLLDMLTIHNKQKFNIFYILIVSLSFSLFAFLSIPIYYIDGAALSRIIALMIGTSFLFFVLSKLHYRLWLNMGRIIPWILIVTTIGYLTKEWNIFIYIPLNLTILLAALFTLGVYNKDELSFIKSQLIKK